MGIFGILADFFENGKGLIKVLFYSIHSVVELNSLVKQTLGVRIRLESVQTHQIV